MKQTQAQPPQQGEALPPWKASGNFTQADADACNKAETKQGEHSPLPWEAQLIFPGQYALVPTKYAKHASSWTIGNIHGQATSEADAKLIVASVNHAGKLAEALREANNVGVWGKSSPTLARIQSALAAYEKDIR